MSIRERLYWFLYNLRRGKLAAQAIGFDYKYYLNRALYGEYHGPNQAYEYDITTTPVFVDPGQKYYRCIYVGHLKPGENGGKHHVLIEVVDTEGYRIDGARLIIWNNNLPPTYATIDKPANEPGTNVPMWWTSTLSIAVDPEWSGVKSDRVSGFHTRWPDEGPDVTLGHHSFFVAFQETISGGEREPFPEPLPGPTLDERVTSLEERVAALEARAWKV